MPTSNYPHSFPNGVTIKEIPAIMQNANGNVFWVDSNKGSDGNKGTFVSPFATIDYAVGRCTADQGDLIIVAAGHVETVTAAGGLDLDVAGISILFMGEGSNRGYITFTTAVSADMDVDANNITLINPRFVAGIDALTGPIDVNAANFKIINGQYEDGTAIDTTDCIVATAAAIGLYIDGWRYVVGDGAGTQKQSNIQLNGVDNAIIKNVDIAGDFGTGPIENVTDEVLNIRFENIKIKSTNSGPIPGMVLDANATGFAKNLDVRIDSGTTYVSNVGKLNWDGSCLGYNTDGYGGDPIGTAGGSGIEAKLDAIQADIGDPSARTNFQDLEDMIGIPDAANSCLDDMLRTGFDSSAITSDADGSVMERLEYLQAQTVGAIGTVHVITKQLISSNIPQDGVGTVDVTAASSGGALIIEEVTMNTDGTGLAAGTNFQLEISGNTYGVTGAIMSEAVANLGANATVAGTGASVTPLAGAVLESGAKIVATSTVAACTGSGVIEMQIKFRRVAAGATVAAA